MMEVYSFEKIPGYSKLSKNQQTIVYRINKYLHCPVWNTHIPMMQRMSVIRSMLNFGDRPFHADELFSNRGSRGGHMNALSLYMLAQHTGNYRVTEVKVEKDIVHAPKTRLQVCKEWAVCFNYEDFCKAYDFYKAYLLSVIAEEM